MTRAERRRGTSYWLSAIPLGGYVLPAVDDAEFRHLPLHKTIAFGILQKIYRPLVRIHAPVTIAGWAFMFALMVYATVQDVGRIV